MIGIFYRKNGAIQVSESVRDLHDFHVEDVVWIDLIDPQDSELDAVESFLGTEVQNKAKAEEIESSSRFRETDNAIYANTNFLMPGPEEYYMEPVSFTIVGKTCPCAPSRNSSTR